MARERVVVWTKGKTIPPFVEIVRSKCGKQIPGGCESLTGLAIVISVLSLLGSRLMSDRLIAD